MILSATGHRPDKLGGYSSLVSKDLLLLAVDTLEQIAPTKVVVGMALGWDFAVGTAAWTLGIPFTAAVPFAGQESRWPEESQRLYRDLLAEAAEVVIVSEGDYSPRKMGVRNEWMVDHSDHLLSLWNGSQGGTWNCVRYANSVGRPMTNVWRQWVMGPACRRLIG